LDDLVGDAFVGKSEMTFGLCERTVYDRILDYRVCHASPSAKIF